MGLHATPHIFWQLSAQLGFQPEDVTPDNAYLLSVPFALCTLPLPNPWASSMDERGKLVYHYKRLGSKQAAHPLLNKAEDLFSALRKQGRPPGSTHCSLVGPFHRPDIQQTYYLDLPSMREVDEKELDPADVSTHRIPTILPEMLIAYGLLPDATPQVERITHLTFYGWWFEDFESEDVTMRVSSACEVGGGLAPRHVTLDYDLATCLCRVTFQDTPAPASSTSCTAGSNTMSVPNVEVTSTSGRRMLAWDLHVGGTVLCMGRRLELKKASLRTMQWHEARAKKLLQLKSALLSELQKYKPQAFAASLAHTRGGTSKAAASVELWRVVEQVQALIATLQEHRPSVADHMARTMAALLTASLPSKGTGGGTPISASGEDAQALAALEAADLAAA